MIVQPASMDFSNQRFSSIIYGSPGVGKTTLALSAPNPILIDFDRGVSRVRANHRTPTIMCDTYEEVLADIRSKEMAEYETIVIDTGGSFVTFLKDWAFRTQPGCKTKGGDFNSLKGFGFVKNEFNRFTEELKTIQNKNVIYVFHSQEQSDKDGSATQRLLCEGSVRNTVWNPCDFGGYVQIINGRRYICFSPEQEYFAKGCHGVTGKREIPELGEDDVNCFMTRLFEEARTNITAENEQFAPQREKYEAAMERGRALIGAVVDVDTANKTLPDFQAIDHGLTSRKELTILWNANAKKLGLFYDRVLGKYTPAPEPKEVV
ncbi:ATP-binding protein [Pseudoflavonifractor sp. 524-17]|uniref:ATP-binding protein n=1 Tax=Pseudoflavonifractor sp. 524-17 TaxID=2304577 RepID=UPI00137AAD00|nr:ATP-binding protein [Pseudoflavonifractor sp. 524-17]NCE63693.1 ATP-binding protein [Pseudoflavonifractor sp. 524-17]